MSIAVIWIRRRLGWGHNPRDISDVATQTTDRLGYLDRHPANFDDGIRRQKSVARSIESVSVTNCRKTYFCMAYIPKAAMGNKTLSAQVDEDSDLARDFERYREQKGMKSKSEAVRTLVRESLDQEFNEARSDDDSSDTESDRASSPVETVSDILSNISLMTLLSVGPIMGAAYLIGGGALTQALEIILGPTTAANIYIGIGLIILMFLVLLLILFMMDLLRQVGNWTAGDDDAADDATAKVQP